jgi:hypothetical protein
MAPDSTRIYGKGKTPGGAASVFFLIGCDRRKDNPLK